MPLDLTAPEYRWPSEWKPQGYGTFDTESFDDWWKRMGSNFPGVDLRVLPQWMHRHWDDSEYWGLPISNVTSCLEYWSIDYILSQVGTPILADRERQYPSPDEEFEHLNSKEASRYEPMFSMNSTGTWNMPLLVLHSLDGFAYHEQTFVSSQYWLIEGHQRFRYLRAMASCGSPADEHEVLVIQTTKPLL